MLLESYATTGEPILWKSVMHSIKSEERWKNKCSNNSPKSWICIRKSRNNWSTSIHFWCWKKIKNAMKPTYQITRKWYHQILMKSRKNILRTFWTYSHSKRLLKGRSFKTLLVHLDLNSERIWFKKNLGLKTFTLDFKSKRFDDFDNIFLIHFWKIKNVWEGFYDWE